MPAIVSGPLRAAVPPSQAARGAVVGNIRRPVARRPVARRSRPSQDAPGPWRRSQPRLRLTCPFARAPYGAARRSSLRERRAAAPHHAAVLEAAMLEVGRDGLARRVAVIHKHRLADALRERGFAVTSRGSLPRLSTGSARKHTKQNRTKGLRDSATGVLQLTHTTWLRASIPTLPQPAKVSSATASSRSTSNSRRIEKRASFTCARLRHSKCTDW